MSHGALEILHVIPMRYESLHAVGTKLGNGGGSGNKEIKSNQIKRRNEYQLTYYGTICGMVSCQ